ncbi:hypothetical protein BV25DRAFT_1089823 [Artomyces pyxidatus]|uniref:Uncharacterized protein n=1 Tax=Artomyces pyxidatus TaxID=48021 RepID=A0ACB8TFS3_9AGAM|nr:hypothetical protein BV25DRAFT_1089823 [Artomyces pyxidatus]
MQPNFPDDLLISPSQHPHRDESLPPTSHTSRQVSTYGSAFSYQSQQDAIVEYGIAGKVWEAAYTMSFYLDSHSMHEFDPPSTFFSRRTVNVIELGSGTGIVGIMLAEKLMTAGRLHDCVVLTDLPEVCPLLEKNLKIHFNQSVANAVSRPLSWGNVEHALRIGYELGACFSESARPSRPLTHIICSDLVYFPELLAPLLRSLLCLTSPPFVPPQTASNPCSSEWRDHTPEIIISYKIRSLSKETPFWSAFGLWFTFSPVVFRSMQPTSPDSSPNSLPDTRWRRYGEDDDAFVFTARRRPESLQWAVPADDAALLNGVGARGSESHKNDDTFELLLMMNLE